MVSRTTGPPLGSQDNTGEEDVALDRIDVGDGCVAACLTLDRPDQLNAVNWGVLRRLQQCLDDVRSDPTVRVVFITGRGRSFCVGGDLTALQDLQAKPEEFSRFVETFNATLRLIRELDRPVVALVNGICVAGGLEIVLACDFAWAAESSRLGDHHLNYAQVGGAGAMSYLPRLIGPGRARELVFSGRLLSSAEALDWGLVNHVFADADLMPSAITMATALASKSFAALRTAKQVINAGLGTDLDEALRFETASALLHCLTLPDARDGATAFVNSRASGRSRKSVTRPVVGQ